MSETILHQYATALRHHQAGDLAAAESGYRAILLAVPHHAEATHGLGVIAYQRGLFDESVRLIAMALQFQPDYPEARNNLVAIRGVLGRSLSESGQDGPALDQFAEVVRLAPTSVVAQHDLGTIFKRLGRLDEAVACYDEAVRLDPSYAPSQLNRATARLLVGDFARGWPEYEWRWRLPDVPPTTLPQPLWDGSPLEGRTILLHAEQGLGDTLQFVRYAPLVQALGGRVILLCPARLHPLLASAAGIDQLAEERNLPSADVRAPLMSLPRLVGPSPDNIVTATAYLRPDPARVELWRERLANVTGFRVGVCWQGNPDHPDDRRRSFPLAALAPLAEIAGVRLIRLQTTPGSDDAVPLVDLDEGVDASGAFVDTAAVMANLDLVVTTDTALAHLAGALGVPVWLALARVPDWRWRLTGETTPWYPSARLFRQREPGDWRPVFAAMADALRAGLAHRGLVTVMIAPGELFDKLTILALKAERMTDAGQVAAVRAELALLEAARDRDLPGWPREQALLDALLAINAALWEVENALRACERDGEFGERFVELARAVYRHNDERGRLKRQLSDRFGCGVCEQKSYTTYQ